MVQRRHPAILIERYAVEVHRRYSPLESHSLEIDPQQVPGTHEGIRARECDVQPHHPASYPGLHPVHNRHLMVRYGQRWVRARLGGRQNIPLLHAARTECHDRRVVHEPYEPGHDPQSGHVAYAYGHHIRTVLRHRHIRKRQNQIHPSGKHTGSGQIHMHRGIHQIVARDRELILDGTWIHRMEPHAYGQIAADRDRRRSSRRARQVEHIRLRDHRVDHKGLIPIVVHRHRVDGILSQVHGAEVERQRVHPHHRPVHHLSGHLQRTVLSRRGVFPLIKTQPLKLDGRRRERRSDDLEIHVQQYPAAVRR